MKNDEPEPRCEPLGRPLSVGEQKFYDECMKKWRETGKCPHALLHIYADDRGPLHGCVVCGEPIA